MKQHSNLTKRYRGNAIARQRPHQALIPLHLEKPLERCIATPPKWATFSENPEAHYEIVGSRELEATTFDRSFLIPGIGARVLNIIFHLQHDRESWVSARDFYDDEPHHIPTPYLSRGLDYLDAVRAGTDKTSLPFIERARRGSGGGSRHKYRLHPDIALTDGRALQRRFDVATLIDEENAETS